MNSSKDSKFKLKEIIESLSGNRVDDFQMNIREFGMDSLKTMDLILTLEDVFEIEIPDEFLVPENLETPQSILSMIERIKNGQIIG